MNLPNRLTVGRVVLTVFFVMALLLPPHGRLLSHFPYGKTAALAIFIVASLTDWWDGWYARRRNLETSFGALMDPLADKILTTAAFICFIEQPSYRGADVPLVQAWMTLVIVSRDFLVTGLRLIASQQGIVLRAEGLGKHKTVSQMVTIIVILIGLAIREDWNCFGVDYQQFNISFSRVAFTLMLITVSLTLISGVIYFFKNGQFFFRDA
ncbi:MAG TPA: CDP-diacylglycerol--glycerol-3-phosphate 3-phosphatidyltransferase [Verrucomicrobiae bacterium]|nr:CDP-diacylglycerol--glycerol-3-phosphate 3-phosphatidyltransferase [Verrucomicrobiae bacterium]